MKKLMVITAFLIPAVAFGNGKNRTVATYRVTVRIGNVITRLYNDITGTSVIFRKQLLLFNDFTYEYTYKGGECTTFDKNESGAWRISNDTIYLKPSYTNSNKIFIIKGNNLNETGSEITKEDWPLKLIRKKH